MMRETSYMSGVSCDKPGCDAAVEGDELPYWEGWEHYLAVAVERGWTAWAPARGSQRHYCPDHGPSRGSDMHRVTPRATRTT